MPVEAGHEDRVREALTTHDTNFLYQYIFNGETPGDRDSAVTFGVSEASKSTDDEEIDRIMLSLVHSSVDPHVIFKEIYRQGFTAGQESAEGTQAHQFITITPVGSLEAPVEEG